MTASLISYLNQDQQLKNISMKAMQTKIFAETLHWKKSLQPTNNNHVSE